MNTIEPTQATGIKIKINDEFVNDISVYSPPSTQINLDFLTPYIKNNAKTMILGDFNACSPFWHCLKYNSNGKTVENFIEQNSLVVKNNKNPTYKHSSNILDLIIATPKISDRIRNVNTKDRLRSPNSRF